MHHITPIVTSSDDEMMRRSHDKRIGTSITIDQEEPFDTYGYKWIGVEIYDDGHICYRGRKRGERIPHEKVIKLIKKTIKKTMRDLETLKKCLRIVESSNTASY